MKSYSSRYLALIFGLAIHCGTVWSSNSGCNPNNPPTLKKVTHDMIVNRWFAQSVIVDTPNNGLPPSQFLSDFNMDFRSSGQLVINGKTAFKPQQCLYEVVEANIDPQTASFTVFFGYWAKKIEMRILDTDFKNWIIVWFCDLVDPNDPNNCTDYVVNHFTLKEDGVLPQGARKHIERSLQKTLCRSDLTEGPKPPKFCDRLGSKPRKCYGRKRNYW